MARSNSQQICEAPLRGRSAAIFGGKGQGARRCGNDAPPSSSAPKFSGDQTKLRSKQTNATNKRNNKRNKQTQQTNKRSAWRYC